MSVRRSDRLSVVALAWLSLLCGPLARPVAAQVSCLEQIPGLGSRFGYEVRIDGDTLLVETSTSSAYVFHREDGFWEHEATLPRPKPGAFPGSTALSGDRVLLGGREAIPAIWRREGDRWGREAVLSPGGGLPAAYGQYYALSGDLAVVCAHDAGQVYFFRRDGAQWIQEDRVQRSNLFGWTIDLDGDVAVVGDFSAPAGESNMAVVLRRTEEGGDVRWETEAELRPDDTSDGCRWFGADVAVSGDVIVVGTAPDFANMPCGRAYVFRYDPDELEWIEEQVLAPDDVVPSDRFGVSVSVSGDVAAIGAMGDSQFEGGSGFGAVYAYRYDGSEWLLAAKVAPPDQQQNDWFARSVAVSGRTVVAGARNAHSRAGALYAFRLGPQVAFTITPEAPMVGEEVTFDASPSSAEDGDEISTYHWDLGGVAAEGPVVTHSYAEPGRFPVSLLASDQGGGCGDVSRMVTVTCPQGDVAPWTSGQVGMPAFQGTARFEGEGESRELVVCAGGDDIRTRIGPDEFHFVYRRVTGDVVLIARVSEMSVKPLAKAGVMLREDLESAARHAAMVFQSPSSPLGSGRFRFIHREERDFSASARSGERTQPPAAWVQLRREGNELVGLSSTDGETWTEVHRVSLELPETLLVGVVAAGRDSEPHQPYSPLVARISHLTLSPSEPAGPAFRRGDANSDGSVNIADGVALLNSLFGGTSSPKCAASADADDSGRMDISDAIYLFNALFGGGPNLPPPTTECGVDPTPDELTCESHTPCL